MSDHEIRRDRHHHRLNTLNAELRGVIDGTVRSVDAGHVTADQALATIREKAAQTDAAIEAAWSEYQDGAE